MSTAKERLLNFASGGTSATPTIPASPSSTESAGQLSARDRLKAWATQGVPASVSAPTNQPTVSQPKPERVDYAAQIADVDAEIKRLSNRNTTFDVSPFSEEENRQAEQRIAQLEQNKKQLQADWQKQKDADVAAIDKRIKEVEASAAELAKRTDLDEYTKRLEIAKLNGAINQLVQAKVKADPNAVDKAWAAASSIIAGVAGGLSAAGETVKEVATGKGKENNYDPNSKSAQLLDLSAKQKELAVSEASAGGKVLGEAIIGIGQTAALSSLAAINPSLPLVAMAAVAAGNKANEVKAQGGTSNQALIRGTISGGIEAATEKLPLDALVDLVKVGGKSALKNLMKQAGLEATEESVSYVANLIFDKIAKDPNAKFSWAELGQAAAGGALSGGLLSGGAMLLNRTTNAGETLTTEKDLKEEAEKAGKKEVHYLPGTGPDANATETAQDGTTNAPASVLPVAGKQTASASSAHSTAVMGEDDAVGYGENTVGGAEARFPYSEAPTQSVSNNLFTESEKEAQGLGNPTHKVYTNAESRYDAEERLAYDYEGEKAALENETWGAAETVMGYKILEDLVEEARESGDWSEVRRWKAIYDQKGTEEGQALQARRQFSGTTAEIVSEAAENLDGEKTKKLKPQKKAQLLDDVYKQAKAYNDIAEGDLNSLIGIIEKNNEIRRTTGLFSKKTSKQMDYALRKIAELYPDTAEQFLRGVAISQIRNITSDYNNVGITEAAKNIRVMNMLSKVSTVMRNLASNNIFDPLESLSNNVGIIADSIMSLATGQRTTAFDTSWASKAKRAGSLEGALKSFVEVGLDVSASDATARYEDSGGDRTFKMAGNPLVRLLSTWAKYENYVLKTTDEFQKGGVAAETQRQIDSLKQKGKLDNDALREWAGETAKQRTFQNDSVPARMMEELRKVGNYAHIGNVGAGDILFPFARVPGNLAAQSMNYSPIGFVNSLRQMTTVMLKAKKGTLTAEEQAQAARNFGRSVSGTALLAGFAALAAKGLIDVAGDDDKDKEALEKAQGRTGTQWNLSATLRSLNGDSEEWQDGDTLVSIGFLDPINSIMAAGSLLADDYKENGASVGGVLKSSLGGVWQAVLDLPAMSSLSDLINTYNYAEGETAAERLINTAIDYTGSQVASFLVPNALKGVAAGIDNTVRDQYGADTVFKNTVDSVKVGIPALRETVPSALDPFGRERTQTGNTALNIANNNILPGYVSKFNQDAVEAELERLNSKTGEASVYPERKAPSKVKYKDNEYQLSQDQKRRYQTTLGQTYYDLAESMMDSDVYRNATAEEQVAYLKIAEAYATQMAKKSVVGGAFKPETYVRNAQKAQDELGLSEAEFLLLYEKYGGTALNGDGVRDAYASGLDIEDYLDYHAGRKGYDADRNKSYTIAETNAAIKGSGLSPEDQVLLWLVEKPEWAEQASKIGVSNESYVKYKVAVNSIVGKKNSANIGKVIRALDIPQEDKRKLLAAN